MSQGLTWIAGRRMPRCSRSVAGRGRGRGPRRLHGMDTMLRSGRRRTATPCKQTWKRPETGSGRRFSPVKGQKMIGILAQKRMHKVPALAALLALVVATCSSRLSSLGAQAAKPKVRRHRHVGRSVRDQCSVGLLC